MNRQGAKTPSPFLETHRTTPAEAGIHPNHGYRLSPVWAHFFASWRLGVATFLFLIWAAPAFAADVAGYWYGEGYQPLWHENAQWLMHLTAGGGYDIEFRQYRYCKLVLDQHETGTWTMGDQFRTVTMRVNGIPTRYENDYRVGALTDTEFDITHVGTGQAYAEKRVDATFRIPPPACPVS